MRCALRCAEWAAQSCFSVATRGKLPSKKYNHTEKENATMEYPKKTATDLPKWSALLIEAVTKPGLIMKAYSAFHTFSVGNQILALVQCQLRGLQPGPLNTFPKWKDLGRFVKRGERALTLCMPITCKRRDEESDEEHTFTSFVYKARWFVFAQTDGQELEPITIPEWDAQRAMKALSIERVPFDHTDGNVQGFSRGRRIAINPLAQLPFKTLFHELAHSILHSDEGDFADHEKGTKRKLNQLWLVLAFGVRAASKPGLPGGSERDRSLIAVERFESSSGSARLRRSGITPARLDSPRFCKVVLHQARGA